MIPQRHQLRVLVTLLALWVGVMAWTFLETGAAERVPLANVGGTVAVNGSIARGATKDALTVNLTLLQSTRARRAAASSSSKNIFELDRGEGVIPGVSALPPREITDLDDPSAYEVQSRPAWAELGEFRYLGYFEVGDRGRRGSKVALLAKGEVLHTARPGEMIGADVLVAGITSSTVTLRHTGSQVEQQLVLADEGSPAIPVY